MSRRPPHRLQRSSLDAERVILTCELEECAHCGEPLVPGSIWFVRKYVPSMNGPLFVEGKTPKCDSPDCSHSGHHYHTNRVFQIRLPQSTYGLDMPALIKCSVRRPRRLRGEEGRPLQAGHKSH
jgi:hypothetical protein